MNKDVALVLSSGGPRGFAYIGAIEELESRGYNIKAVAGTSIGSLVGGIYAAGKLQEVKEWLFSLDAWRVFTLMDVSISMNHLVKGEKVIDALREIVPDVNIEDLKIPYCAIATDLYTGEEIVFRDGDLFTAIRASISIPSLFSPVKYGYRTLIDGGIANTLPLNRVERKGNEIVVAFNVNDVDIDSIRQSIIDEVRMEEQKLAEERAISAETKAIMNSVRNNDNLTWSEKMRLAGAQGYKLLARAIKGEDKNEGALDFDDSYYSILSRSFSLMNHVNAKLSAELYRPDILINMPFDAYGDIADYAKASEICETGRELMRDALNKYEASL